MITAAQALAALEAVVQRDGPETVYVQVGDGSASQKRCRYEFNGAPSCLVGRALFELGFTIEDLQTLDQHDYPARKLSSAFSDRITDGAAFVLDHAQHLQDLGNTWGAALEAARQSSLQIGVPA